MGLVKKILLRTIMPSTANLNTAKTGFMKKLGNSALSSLDDEFNPMKRLKNKFSQFGYETEEEKRRRMMTGG